MTTPADEALSVGRDTARDVSTKSWQAPSAVGQAVRRAATEVDQHAFRVDTVSAATSSLANNTTAAKPELVRAWDGLRETADAGMSSYEARTAIQEARQVARDAAAPPAPSERREALVRDELLAMRQLGPDQFRQMIDDELPNNDALGYVLRSSWGRATLATTDGVPDGYAEDLAERALAAGSGKSKERKAALAMLEHLDDLERARQMEDLRAQQFRKMLSAGYRPSEEAAKWQRRAEGER